MQQKDLTQKLNDGELYISQRDRSKFICRGNYFNTHFWNFSSLKHDKDKNPSQKCLPNENESRPKDTLFIALLKSCCGIRKPFKAFKQLEKNNSNLCISKDKDILCFHTSEINLSTRASSTTENTINDSKY